MSYIVKKSAKSNTSILAISCGALCFAGLAVVLVATSVAAQPAPQPALKKMRPMVITPNPAPPAPPTVSIPSGLGRSTSVGSLTREVQESVVLAGVRAKAKLLESATMDEFILNLPNQERPRPDRNFAKGPGESTTEAAPEGGRTRNYGVTKQRYSMSDTPDEIVTFEPVSGFWLGAILEEQGLRGGLGSQREVPIPASGRASFRVTVNSLAIPNSYRDITSPSMSSVNAAIGDMIRSAGNVDIGTAMSMNVVENFNTTQTAMALNLDASYISARVRAALDSRSSASRQAVTLSFVQRAFTVAMDTEGRNRAPAFFNDAFTLDQAKDLVNQGRLGFTNSAIADFNPPNYLKSITYGRAILVNVVSNIDRSDLKTFLSGSYNSGAFAVSADAGLQNQRQNEQFELQITTFGGPGRALDRLVVPVSNRGDVLRTLNSYLQAPAPLTTMVPISYAAYSLRDDRLATIQRTTEYTVTQYTPQPMGQRVKLDIRFVPYGGDGTADGTNELFGTVRINNQIVSQIDRAASGGNGREDGQALEMKKANAPNEPITIEWYFGDPEPIVEIDMWDADSGSGDDWLYKKRFTLPMAGLAESDTAQFIDNQFSPDQGAVSRVIIDMTKIADM